MSDEVLVWLSVWSEVQIVCIWSSWPRPDPILIVILIIIGIPSPTHSLTLCLNPSFSANPSYRSLFSPSGFTIWISHTVYCYF